jgi:hypothetical protein
MSFRCLCRQLFHGFLAAGEQLKYAPGASVVCVTRKHDLKPETSIIDEECKDNWLPLRTPMSDAFTLSSDTTDHMEAHAKFDILLCHQFEPDCRVRGSRGFIVQFRRYIEHKLRRVERANRRVSGRRLAHRSFTHNCPASHCCKHHSLSQLRPYFALAGRIR